MITPPRIIDHPNRDRSFQFRRKTLGNGGDDYDKELKRARKIRMRWDSQGQIRLDKTGREREKDAPGVPTSLRHGQSILINTNLSPSLLLFLSHILWMSVISALSCLQIPRPEEMKKWCLDKQTLEDSSTLWVDCNDNHTKSALAGAKCVQWSSKWWWSNLLNYCWSRCLWSIEVGDGGGDVGDEHRREWAKWKAAPCSFSLFPHSLPQEREQYSGYI